MDATTALAASIDEIAELNPNNPAIPHIGQTPITDCSGTNSGLASAGLLLANSIRFPDVASDGHLCLVAVDMPLCQDRAAEPTTLSISFIQSDWYRS